MSKDSYWFKHDSTAGRGLKMRKMQHIYGHEGKGMYWDVVEILRDQDGYKFDSDESSLQLLSDLIGYKDQARFITWFRDCLRLELFKSVGKNFMCPPLHKNMKKWENKKSNGSKGGRPKKTESITKSEPNLKAKRKHKIREEKIREEKIIKGFKPPSQEEVVEYFKENEFMPSKGIEAFLYYEVGNWKDSKGNQVRSWKQKMRGVWFKPENKQPSLEFVPSTYAEKLKNV